MDMFEKASRLKIRFSSAVGLITVEDLWDMSLTNLNGIAKHLNKELKSAEEDDFLKEKSTADAEVKLGFDIVLHILNTKKEEADKRKDAKAKKEKKQMLLEKFKNKQDAIYDEMTKEELEKEIAELE